MVKQIRLRKAVQSYMSYKTDSYDQVESEHFFSMLTLMPVLIPIPLWAGSPIGCTHGINDVEAEEPQSSCFGDITMFYCSLPQHVSQ